MFEAHIFFFHIFLFVIEFFIGFYFIFEVIYRAFFATKLINF